MERPNQSDATRMPRTTGHGTSNPNTDRTAKDQHKTGPNNHNKDRTILALNKLLNLKDAWCKRLK